MCRVTSVRDSKTIALCTVVTHLNHPTRRVGTLSVTTLTIQPKYRSEQQPAMLARVLFTAASLASIALANVEKIIFSAPPPSFIPLASPSLEDLHLDALTPAALSLTRNVSRVFPSESAPRGLESWYLLDNLSEGQRYELRICWAAIVSPFDTERVDAS